MSVESLQLEVSADESQPKTAGKSHRRRSAAAVGQPVHVDEQRLAKLAHRKHRWRYTRWPSSEALPVERSRSAFLIEVDPVAARGAPPSRWAGCSSYLRASRVWLISTLAHALLVTLLAVFCISSSETEETLILFGDVEPRDPPRLESLTVEIDIPRAQVASRVVDPLVDVAIPSADELPGLLAALPSSESASKSSGPVGEVRALFGRDGAGLADEGAGQGGAEFFGVKAEGDKFVFVVDCSRSMTGEKWRNACAELESAIARLGESKSFYVIFFDGEMHPMFFAPDLVAPALIPASADNLERFRGWLATCRLGYFTEPWPAVKLALSLEPDAIYLLSDGEFSDPTASHLQRYNKIDRDGVLKMPAVVVHTIGFYSRDGQRTLRQIARNNGGRYRFISIAPDEDLSRK